MRKVNNQCKNDIIDMPTNKCGKSMKTKTISIGILDGYYYENEVKSGKVIYSDSKGNIQVRRISENKYLNDTIINLKLHL